LSILGQTAPGNGIEIRSIANPTQNFDSTGSSRSMLVFEDSTHVVLRFLRLRCTMPTNTTITSERISGVTMWGSQHIVIDHVSIAHCQTVLFLANCRDLTVRHSLLAEPKTRLNSDNAYGIQLRDYSGTDVRRHSLAYNVLTHTKTVLSGESLTPAEIIGNIVYNWRNFGLQLYPSGDESSQRLKYVFV